MHATGDHKYYWLLGIIIFSALGVQLLAHYYRMYIVWANYFYVIPFITRFGFLTLVNVFILKIPWFQMGIRLPDISKRLLFFLFLATIIVTFVVFLICSNQGYTSFYSRNLGSKNVNIFYKIEMFGLFTSSTFLGWEFLHRSFLLFGLSNILFKKLKQDIVVSRLIPVMFVSVFEVLFHFSKPVEEAFGMLLGSPILSYIALRTKSIFISLIIHLYIEIVFFFIILFSI